MSKKISPELNKYAKELVKDGFEVWYVNSGYTSNGFLVYTKGGYWGIFQNSEFEGWGHTMPISPSKENGSGMLIEHDNQWSVDAANKTAQPQNSNPVTKQYNLKNEGSSFKRRHLDNAEKIK